MAFSKEAEIYDLFHRDKNYLTEARTLKKIYPQAKTILEIGAGTGKLTEELVRLGFDVTAIEPSDEMVGMSTILGGIRVPTLGGKLEDISISNFKRGQFDLVLAHYDVLNYIPHEKRIENMEKILKWGKKWDIEVWDPALGVRPITVKIVPGWVRIRLGFKWNMVAHLWYFYIGKGFIVEKHTLYL